VKGKLRVMSLIFNLLLYIHVYTCFYWYVFKIEKDWIPPMEFIYKKSTLYEKNNTYQYFFCMYYAMMAFGRNDVSPRSNLELVFICITMIISAFFNAYIFGTISGLYTQIRMKTVKFNDNIDTAN
jgi:hypothetical protein